MMKIALRSYSYCCCSGSVYSNLKSLPRAAWLLVSALLLLCSKQMQSSLLLTLSPLTFNRITILQASKCRLRRPFWWNRVLNGQ